MTRRNDRYANAVSGLPMPESTDTATGLVLANGWFGKAAPTVAPERSAETFASRDGGRTWFTLYGL